MTEKKGEVKELQEADTGVEVIKTTVWSAGESKEFTPEEVTAGKADEWITQTIDRARIKRADIRHAELLREWKAAEDAAKAKAEEPNE